MSAVPTPPTASPQGRDQYGFALDAKPPRPAAKIGAGVLMVGGALHVIAVFVPWYQGGGRSLTGLDDFVTPNGDLLSAPGKVWIVVGAVLFALGLATYLARRALGVAIAAVVVSTLGLFTSLLGVGAASNMKKLYDGVGEPATGAFVGIVSILVALAGSIQILSRRRR